MQRRGLCNHKKISWYINDNLAFTTEDTESHRVFSFYKLMTDTTDFDSLKKLCELCVLCGEINSSQLSPFSEPLYSSGFPVKLLFISRVDGEGHSAVSGMSSDTCVQLVRHWCLSR